MKTNNQPQEVNCYYCGADRVIIEIDGAGIADPICCEVA